MQFTEEKEKYNWFFDDQLIWRTKAALKDEEQNRRLESKKQFQLNTLRVEMESRSRRISQTIDLPSKYDEKGIQTNEGKEEEEKKEEVKEEEKKDNENDEEKKDSEEEEENNDEEEVQNDIITEDDLEVPTETGFVDESEDYGTEEDYKNDLDNLGYINDNEDEEEEGYGGEILGLEDPNQNVSSYSEERSKSSIINRSAPRLSHISTVKSSQSDTLDPLNVYIIIYLIIIEE